MNNTIINYEEKGILAGAFPVVAETLKLKTSLEAGDIIGVDASGNYGKLDTATYTEPYAIAYDSATHDTSDVDCVAMLTGEILKDFVKLPSGTETATIQKLRKLGIFIK